MNDEEPDSIYLSNTGAICYESFWVIKRVIKKLYLSKVLD